MILLIDNYDSFTFNLYQYLTELGAEVVVHRNDKISLAQIEEMLPRLSQIVISPGPCTPADAGISIELVREFAGRVPMLGVCLGHQAIGATFGGNVIRADEIMHGKTSLIHHNDTGVFAGLPNPFEATRYHSLFVERASLPADLEVTAETSDGVIMGLRHRQFEIEGVQFHPESILTSAGKDLLANFIGVRQPVSAATIGY